MAGNYARVTAHIHKQYVWGLRYIDAPVLRDRETDGGSAGLDERLYYTQDGNFNVTALVNPAGQVVERYSYDAYGQVTVLDGDWSVDADGLSDVDNRILYCGYRFDSETGLYHVRHRYLHPTLGRWITQDPLGYVDGMGLYEYCVSTPFVMLDAMGTKGHANELSSELKKWELRRAIEDLADKSDRVMDATLYMRTTCCRDDAKAQGLAKKALESVETTNTVLAVGVGVLTATRVVDRYIVPWYASPINKTVGTVGTITTIVGAGIEAGMLLNQVVNHGAWGEHASHDANMRANRHAINLGATGVVLATSGPPGAVIGLTAAVASMAAEHIDREADELLEAAQSAVNDLACVENKLQLDRRLKRLAQARATVARLNAQAANEE